MEMLESMLNLGGTESKGGAVSNIIYLSSPLENQNEATPETHYIIKHIISDSSSSSQNFPLIFVENDQDMVTAQADGASDDSYTIHIKEELVNINLEGLNGGSLESDSSTLEPPPPSLSTKEEAPTSVTKSPHQEEQEGVTSSSLELEKFMEVVTTYKCRFCRFTCGWKSGLMSHLRSCHLADAAISEIQDESSSISSSSSTSTTSLSFATASQTASTTSTTALSTCTIATSAISPATTTMVSSASSQVINDTEPLPQSLCITQLDQGSPTQDGQGKDASEEEQPKEEEQVQEIYMCGQCEKTFDSLELCRDHMEQIHNAILDGPRKRGRKKKSLVQPGDENEDAKDEEGPSSKAKKSQKDLIAERPYRCNERGCGYRFTSEANLQYHAQCHASKKPFQCTECHQGTFEHWRSLVMHLWREHGMDIDLHTCDICGYKIFSQFKLQNHKLIHSDERSFMCDTCGKGFKQLGQLRNHAVMHLDRRNLGGEQRWYSQQPCPECGRMFADSKCLRKHRLAVHRKARPFACTFCDHTCARKAMLQLHIRSQHTGEKPFSCQWCDYRTGDHNSLRRHKMRHTGDKPYKCPYCDYACIQAISYKCHMKNKHPGIDGIYSCYLCSFKSVSVDNYLNHMCDHGLSVTSFGPTIQLTKETLKQIESLIPSSSTTTSTTVSNNSSAAQTLLTCLSSISSSVETEQVVESSSIEASQTPSIELSSSPPPHLSDHLYQAVAPPHSIDIISSSAVCS